MMKMSDIIKNKIDIVYFFEVKNGNPNGDPETGNCPRVDFETGKGIVTDVCMKRKIRNAVANRYGDRDDCKIYITNGTSLEQNCRSAYDFLGKTEKQIKEEYKKDKIGLSKDINNYMTSTFFDISAFGGVMTLFNQKDLMLSCASVRGPIQFSMPTSVDKITPTEVSITRCALATENESKDKNNTMGSKWIIPYGLYMGHIYISANQAEKTNFTEEKLNIFLDCLKNAFEDDHSAARGEMNMRDIFVFTHNSKHGNCPSYELFDKVSAKKNTDTPRCYSDYTIEIDDKSIPENVTLKRL